MAEPQNISTRTRSHSGLGFGLPFGGRQVRPLGFLFGAALMLAACSGDSDAASVPTVQLEPTTSISSAPTTTTTEATTTTEDPAVAYERDVAEITAVYDQQFAYLTIHGAVVDEDALESFAIDPLLARKVANTAAWEMEGYLIGDAYYEFRVVHLEVLEDEASLETCDFDAIELLTADGSQVIIPADVERYLWSTSLRRTEAGWRVYETVYTNGEATPCDA